MSALSQRILNTEASVSRTKHEDYSGLHAQEEDSPARPTARAACMGTSPIETIILDNNDLITDINADHSHGSGPYDGGEYSWYCHECGNGPMASWNNFCSSCSHAPCGSCIVEEH